MTKSIVYLAFVILIPAQLFAQSEFLKDGQSGWAAGLSIAYSKYSSGFGAEFGYSFSGRVDAALGLGRSYGEARAFMVDDYQPYGNFLAPRITCLLQKQIEDSKFPSIALTISCQVMNLKTPQEKWASWPIGYLGRSINSTTEFSSSVAFSILRDFIFSEKNTSQWNLTAELTRHEGANQYSALTGYSYGFLIGDGYKLILSPVVGLIVAPSDYFIFSGLEIVILSM
jgi:hypothetical protein